MTEKNQPFVYCDKDLKDKPQMKRWRTKLTTGKEVTATLARKNKLPTVKEYDQKIKEIEKRIEENEIAYEKREITTTVYEQVRRVAIQELSLSKHDRQVRERVNYLGQQEEFLKYLPNLVERP